ncbi:hypothetical protein [Nonomuraea angiospora]|uniref:hypothetical protein n=1 Tax=Nonomuraea angiospora TaxID=46172 RepID=UPI0029BC4B68|nr:hypothetical protein [Nonomuraea angiospora]MDX3100365.1 hypothetical protein [Nonomuraea angiospora]
MLLRLAYLAVTNTFAALRLSPMGDRDKDVEILALRHQIAVLERQLGVGARARFAPEDRAFLATLLAPLPRDVLRRLRLLVRPDTVIPGRHVLDAGLNPPHVAEGRRAEPAFWFRSFGSSAAKGREGLNSAPWLSESLALKLSICFQAERRDTCQQNGMGAPPVTSEERAAP